MVAHGYLVALFSLSRVLRHVLVAGLIMYGELVLHKVEAVGLRLVRVGDHVLDCQSRCRSKQMVQHREGSALEG